VRPIYRTGVLLLSRCCILCIFSTNISIEYFTHAAHSPFFSSKCRLFHNAIFFWFMYYSHFTYRMCYNLNVKFKGCISVHHRTIQINLKLRCQKMNSIATRRLTILCWWERLSTADSLYFCSKISNFFSWLLAVWMLSFLPTCILPNHPFRHFSTWHFTPKDLTLMLSRNDWQHLPSISKERIPKFTPISCHVLPVTFVYHWFVIFFLS
jgi:hypothetical protein